MSLQNYLNELKLKYKKEYTIGNIFCMFRIDYIVFTNGYKEVDIIEEKTNYQEVLKAIGQLIIYKKFLENEGFKVNRLIIYCEEKNSKIENLKKIVWPEIIMVKDIVAKLTKYATKWVNRAVAAQPDYEAAISETPTEYWQSQALKAAETYKSAMKEVIEKGYWEGGISNPKKDWHSETLKKAKRRAEGIQISGPSAWQLGFSPFAEALNRVLATLPPRGPALSENNIKRAQMVWQEMHNTKVARRGKKAAAVATALAPVAPRFY